MEAGQRKGILLLVTLQNTKHVQTTQTKFQRQAKQTCAGKGQKVSIMLEEYFLRDFVCCHARVLPLKGASKIKAKLNVEPWGDVGPQYFFSPLRPSLSC